MRLGTLTVLFLLILAGPAHAVGLVGTNARLKREMRSAGGAAGAYVVDLGTDRRVFALEPDTPRVPASVNKLWTAAATLLRLGPEGRLPTNVLADAAPDFQGTVAGDLYLRGGGDPTFDRPQLRQLAEQLAFEQGLVEVTGRIVGDESYLDARRGPPSSRYRVSRWVGVLSGLPFRPASATLTGNPALSAAKAFRRELGLAGVKVRGKATTGVSPTTAVPVLQLVSPTVAGIVNGMNKRSDNFYAETLIKVLGADFAGDGSTSAGARVIRRAVASFGTRPRVVDGSGLSRSNASSPRQVVSLLRAMYHRDDPVGDAFVNSLAVAGRNGTLSDRMRTSPARDRCTGKTGSLISVSALAGYCRTVNGHVVAYAILMNRVNLHGARAIQDRVLAHLANYTG